MKQVTMRNITYVLIVAFICAATVAEANSIKLRNQTNYKVLFMWGSQRHEIGPSGEATINTGSDRHAKIEAGIYVYPEGGSVKSGDTTGASYWSTAALFEKGGNWYCHQTDVDTLRFGNSWNELIRQHTGNYSYTGDVPLFNYAPNIKKNMHGGWTHRDCTVTFTKQ